MSKTLDQIYIANPITSNASTDLMYFVQSPYTVGTDAAMTYANFAAQFASPALTTNYIYIGVGGVATASQTLPTAVQGNITQLGTQSQVLNMGGNQISNVADPTHSQDAATMNYVSTIAAGLNPVDGVYAASTANLTSWTYLNGVSGVGATLTAPSNGVFTVDGVSPPVGSRFLYKNDTTYTGTANGIYTVTTSTSGSPAVLTRATDYDQPSQISVGDLISVEFGTANATSSWYQTATVVTIGVSAISFSVWFNPASYVSSALTSGHIFVGNGSNIAAGVAVSGDATLSNTGALTVASIGGEAVSLGGSFTMSGAHTFSGTLTGNTSVTFPNSATPTASTISQWDSNNNLSANNHIEAYTTTVTSASTVTLTVGSTYQQYFTGSTAQTVVLPVTSTLTLGFQFQIVNNSSQTLTVESSGTNTVLAMAADTAAYFTCILTSGTSAASWNYEYNTQTAGSGTVTSVATSGLATGGTITTTGTITVTAAAKADQETATSSSVAVTPAVQQYHPSACGAWGYITSPSSSPPTISASYNVTSITRNSTGTYTIVLTNGFSSADYAILVTIWDGIALECRIQANLEHK